jgi:dTDP-4-dehydrorhamnose 3,5-epimerase
MKVSKTTLPGLLLIEPKVYPDSRGYFFESYNTRLLNNAGVEHVFVQDNQSSSQFGVIRGLHYQREPHAQTKLIRVLSGSIFDVAVDLRKNSPTYGQWYGIELSADNHLQLLIPKGFAHGFSVLSGQADILYKCDDFYAPEYEGGINCMDSFLNIDWKIPTEKAIISSRDTSMPSFENAVHNFIFTAG